MTAEMIFIHLFVVIASVFLTLIIGVPLGICAYYFPSMRPFILKTVEILQTVPTLALLGVIMILFGPGKTTVIVGLFLYSLLPIVLNTYAGLSEVPLSLIEVATGMGMTKINRLVQVEIPIAFPFIFAGVRIATVTSIGVAVFGAFVGGGGLGSIIYTSIRTSNMPLLLSSTFALMGMAVLFDFAMQYAGKFVQSVFIMQPPASSHKRKNQANQHRTPHIEES